MLRIWGSGILRYTFSKINIVEGIKTDVAGMENISKLPFYQSFKTGLNFTLQHRFQQANQSFQQALNQLEQRKQQLNEHYLHIYNKMISNNLEMKKYKAVEQNIYALIKLKKKYHFQSVLLYQDYNTLFQLFLRYNVQRAIILGKALLTEKEVEGMSLKHKKIFLFNLANAYFLIGNYGDAKSKYSQCINSDPDNDLKIKAYNNLGLACWWHKNPFFSQKTIDSQQSKDIADSDFKQTRQIFLKAIQTSQQPDSIASQQEKYKLKQALNEFEFDITANFQKKQSVLPIFNLVEYYINNTPAEKIKILYWLRTLLQLSKSTGEEKIYDEVYTTLCILNNDKVNLHKFINFALDKYKNKFEQIYYSKLGLFLAKSQGKKQESQKLSLRIGQLEEKYRNQDQFIFKRKFLSLLPMDL